MWRVFKRTVLFVLWTIPVGFAENAFFGWAQFELGVTNDLVAHVIRYSIMWGVPALTVAVGYYFYFRIEQHFSRQQTRPELAAAMSNTATPKMKPERTPGAGTLSVPARGALGIDPTPQPPGTAALERPPAKSRFGPPRGKEHIRLGPLSNRDLGDMMISLSKKLQQDVARAHYPTTNAQLVNAFLSNFAPEVFWLCEEAAQRGLHSDHLDMVMRFPDRLQNRDAVSYIARELEKFGNIVKLYI